MTKRLLQFLLISIALFMGTSSFAQLHTFQWVNGSGSYDGQVKSVDYSNSGDFIYAGGWLWGGGGAHIPTTISGSAQQNGFVAKYDLDGNPIWAFNVGNSGEDEVSAVAVDNLGNVIVAGSFENSNVDFAGTSGGSNTLSSVGGKDVFIAKYNSLGVLLWLSQGTSAGNDFIHDIEIDQNNDIYLAGSSNGIFTYNSNSITTNGGLEAFALKINSAGGFEWMNSAGTILEDRFTAVTVFAGQAYFGGYYQGSGTGKLGALTSVANPDPGKSEMMIAHYDASSGSDVNAVRFGGVDDDEIYGLTNDGLTLYLTGNTEGNLSIDADVYNNAYQEIVIARLDNGLNLISSQTTSHASAGEGNGWGIDFVGNDKVVVVGDFTGPLNTGFAIAPSTGTSDGIVLTYKASTMTVIDQTVISGSNLKSARTIASKSDFEMYIGGTHISNSTFTPINVSGNNGFNHPFLAEFGCVPATVALSGDNSICATGSTDLTFNFTGDSPYNVTYTDGTNTFNLSGITTSTYTVSVSPLVNTTYSIAGFTSASCGSTFSGTATIAIISSVTDNIVYGDTTHCGPSGSFFTGSVPTGAGNGTITYLWQYNTPPFPTWLSGQGTNNLQDYNSTIDNTIRNYRRIVTISGCPSSTSNVVTATILPTLSGNNMPADEQYCGPTNPTVITAGTVSGGNSSYTYEWIEDDNSAMTTPTTVATTANYDPNTLSVTTFYRRIVFSDVCADTSTKLVITIEPVITGNTISADDTICGPASPGTLFGSVPAGGDGSFGYGWQQSTDASTWTDVVGSQNYTPGSLTNTTWFRRFAVSGTCTTPDTSNVIKITVHEPVKDNTISYIGVNPICQGDTPSTINGSTIGGGNLTTYDYLWESSLDGITWNNASGINNTINYSPPPQNDTLHFRRIVTSGLCGGDTSNVFIVAVYPPITNNSIFTAQTKCANTVPELLTGTTPTGGSTGPYIYNWQSSTDNITFNSITGTNAINYQPDTLFTTTFFRRRVNRGTCGLYSSDTVTITVEPAITNNTISADQLLCGPNTAAILDGTTATGGNGSMIYGWFQSTDSLVWNSVATTEDYSPGTVSLTTYYFRTVVSGACAVEDTSNVITIFVQPVLANNSISAAQTLCGPSTATTLDGTVATGGTGVMNYTWYSSIDNINWTNAATTEDYSPGLVSQTTYYYRTVSSGACTLENTTLVLTITVEPEITNNSISSDQLLCGTNTTAGLIGSFASGGSGTMSYKWFESIDSVTWSTVATTQNYDPLSVVQTTFYLRTVTSGSCSDEDTSNVVTITYEPAISNNSISADQNICVNAQPDTIFGLTVTSTAGPILYSWTQSTDFTTWTAGVGVISGDDFVPPSLSDTIWYRRLAKAGFCPADTSNIVVVFVEDSIANNILTSPPTICSNDATGVVMGSLPINGVNSYTYEWEKSFNDTLWSTIGSSNTQNLSIGGISTNTYFRRIVTSGECGTDTSASVLQQVSPFITTNSVGNAQTICYDSIPNLLFGTVQTPGSFGFSWQQSTDSVTFSIASGTYSNVSYQAGNLDSTTYYYRIIKSGACPNDTSNIIKITTLDNISNNIISSDTTVCFGTTGIDLPGSLPTGGDGNYVYAWESSIDGINYSTASGISPANGMVFTTSSMTQSTFFRRIVYNTPCSKDSLISNVITVTVEAPLGNNTIGADQVLCGNYLADTLVGSAISGGSGAPNYEWQWKATTGSWLYILGASAQDYAPGVVTDTVFYRRIATSGSCLIGDTSNIVTLTYLDFITGNTIAQNDTICYGDSTTLTGPFFFGGDGTYTEIWEEMSNGSSWGPASGTFDVFGYYTGPLTDTTEFRRVLQSSVCPTDTSNSLIIVVEDSIANNIISIPQAVCSDNPNDSIFGTLPIGGNTIYSYQWEVYDSLTMQWTAAPGVNTNQNYALGLITDSAYYRRIVTSGICGSHTSAALLVEINYAINTNTIVQDDSICMNTIPVLLTGTTPSGSGFVYVWESSTDNVNFTVELGGMFSSTFQPDALDSTRYYRRIVSSGICNPNTSNLVTITVWDSLSNNTIANDTSICYNDSAIMLIGSNVMGGSGNFDYLWEFSSDGVNFATPTVNFTSSNYVTGYLTQSTYFRRRAVDNICANDTLYSNVVLITVYDEITHNYLVDADTICEGLDANVLFQISGDSPFSIAYTNAGVPAVASNIGLSGHPWSFTPNINGIIVLDTVYNTHGCFITPADTFTYRVVAYPVVSLDEDTTVCEEVVFNATHGSGDLTFESATLGTLLPIFPLTYNSTSYGMHEFVLTEDVEGCIDRDTINVTFIESVANISAGFDQDFILVDSLYLDATDLLANETGVWTLISGGGNFADTTDPQTLFSNIISGQTILEWTVTNGICPSKSAQVILDIRNLVNPTGFSPNGDGANDFLEFAGREDIPTIRIQVYDRWGGIVFEDDDYQNDWNGTNKEGEPLPEDTYFMVVDLGDKGITKSYLVIRR